MATCGGVVVDYRHPWRLFLFSRMFVLLFFQRGRRPRAAGESRPRVEEPGESHLGLLECLFYFSVELITFLFFGGVPWRDLEGFSLVFILSGITSLSFSLVSGLRSGAVRLFWG